MVKRERKTFKVRIHTRCQDKARLAEQQISREVGGVEQSTLVFPGYLAGDKISVYLSSVQIFMALI